MVSGGHGMPIPEQMGTERRPFPICVLWATKTVEAPVVSSCEGEAGAHGDEPTLAPFATVDVQAFGRLVEVIPLQRQGLANTQAGVGRQDE